jgi:hypothetical protein
MFKVILYIAGFMMIIGVGMWFEFHSGDYPRLENKTKSIQRD